MKMTTEDKLLNELIEKITPICTTEEDIEGIRVGTSLNLKVKKNDKVVKKVKWKSSNEAVVSVSKTGKIKAKKKGKAVISA